MDDKKLLKNIGDLIDTKLDQKLKPINEKLETLDSNMETVSSRVDKLDNKFKPISEKLEILEIKIEMINKKIDKSQEETIETLSELITSGYNAHEKRIKKIEDHLQLPQTQ